MSGWQVIAEGDRTEEARSVLDDLVSKGAVRGPVPSLRCVPPWTIVIGDPGQENVATAFEEKGWRVQQLNDSGDSG